MADRERMLDEELPLVPAADRRAQRLPEAAKHSSALANDQVTCRAQVRDVEARGRLAIAKKPQAHSETAADRRGTQRKLDQAVRQHGSGRDRGCSSKRTAFAVLPGCPHASAPPCKEEEHENDTAGAKLQRHLGVVIMGMNDPLVRDLVEAFIEPVDLGE